MEEKIIKIKLYEFDELSKEVQKDILETWSSKHASEMDQVDSDDDEYETYVEELIDSNDYRFTKDGELASNLFPYQEGNKAHHTKYGKIEGGN